MATWESVLTFAPNTIRDEVLTISAPAVFAPDYFDADSITLDRAIGGFNAVVEISAACCLRVFHASTFELPYASHENIQLTLTAQELEAFFAADPAPFASARLNWLRLGAGTLTSYVLTLTPLPVSLEFSAPNQIEVMYDVTARLDRIGSMNSMILSTPHSDGRMTRVGGNWIEQGGDIGSFTLRITAGYEIVRYDDQTVIDVRAMLGEAQVTIELGTGDMTRLLAGLPSLAAIDWVKTVQGFGTVRISPPVSLVGGEPPGASAMHTVDEFTDYDVAVFHVNGPLRRQALAFAFDVRRGCHGIIESVEHFIGTYDYGVIFDEFVIQQSIQYRWRIGDFPRRLWLSAPIKFQKNGALVDGTASGVLRLDTLEFASVVFSSNAGTQVMNIGGLATIEHVNGRLNDGTIVGPNYVPIGEGLQTSWALIMVPVLQPIPSPVIDLQPFQDKLQRGVWRHLAKPFALLDDTYALPSPAADYVRLSTYPPGNFFCLGTIPDGLLGYLGFQYLI